MFGFMKKHSDRDKEERERKKKEKKEKKDAKKKGDPKRPLTEEDLSRLEEVRRDLIHKSSSSDGGIRNSDSYEGMAVAYKDPQEYGQAGDDSSESGSVGSQGQVSPRDDGQDPAQKQFTSYTKVELTKPMKPAVMPKPTSRPKRGILKGKSNYGPEIPNHGVRGQLDDTMVLEENTMINEELSGVMPKEGTAAVGGPPPPLPAEGPPVRTQSATGPSGPKVRRVPSRGAPGGPPRGPPPPRPRPDHHHPSNGLVPPQDPSSKFLEPSPLSPTEKTFGNVDLKLPSLAPPRCPRPRDITLRRQPAGDFGFTLRRGTVLERGAGDNTERKRTVIFAEPGPKNNQTGLLPGDRLIEVNSSNVENSSREEIIEMIRNSSDSVVLKVQPIPELSELSMRSGLDGEEVSIEEQSMRTGTLQRSGSMRFKSRAARSEAEIAVERAWLSAEKVWLVHRAGFTGARVLKSTDTPDGTDPPAEGRCKVKLDFNGQVLEVDEEDVEKANPPQFDRVEDMASLRYMNESSVLHTLRQRYGSNLIHTYGGRAQIIINPMHPMSIYSDKVIQMFRGCRAEDMPPHIYACAQIAYRQMLSTRQDQSILMMGRSGSGKTANARHVLQYLTATAGTVSNVLTVEKLMAIFTLLDAFGNSRTVMNTSATKYTQITSLDFDHAGQIAAASIQVLMLDRSRVVRRAEGEPTFHIFYYLLAGIDSTLRAELQLQNLNEPNLFMTPLQRDRHRVIYGGSSAEDRQRATAMWAKIHHAMNALGIKEGEAKSIYACLAAIYHLGVAGVAKGANNKYQFGRPAAAQRAAAVLGTSVEELSRTIFTASGQQRGTLRSPSHGEKMSGPEMVLGMEALEGFVVGLYSEAFHAVVALINRALSSNFRTVSSILVLDMPGFQNPASCGRNTGASFEDMCHNYAQERLQLLFHDTVFTSQQDLYSQENVECDFEMVTTSPAAMVALIDRPPEQNVQSPTQASRAKQVRPDANDADKRGLLWLLDEEALFPGATEDSFIERLYSHHGDPKEKLLLRSRAVSVSEGEEEATEAGESLLKKGQGNPFFVLNHFQGTNPVTYNVRGWLRASRENPVARTVNVFLQDSQKPEMTELFTHVRGPTSIISGSVGGIEGNSSLRRASSIRRSYTTGTAGLKRKSVCLQVKFQVDSIIDTLRRTRMHFVHCLLPQNNAGLCDLRSALVAPKSGTQDDIVINVPLVRSQLRGTELVDAIRIHRQGFPEHMLFGEFRRRFEILVPPEGRPNDSVTDEKLAVEKLTAHIEIDKASYRLGLSQIFFRAGGLAQLEDARDEKITGTIVALQAYCRGYLGRQNLKKLKLQHMAVTCIQRNVKKFMAIRGWPWWRLYTKVQPLLNVHRTEEELRDKEVELEQLKTKVEKLERERNEYKHSVEKLETKLSEMTADYAEEHTTSNQATELLEAETTQRMRLEKELKDIQSKHAVLQRKHETTEMDLVQAQLIVASLDGDMEDDDDLDGDSIYRQKYERLRREMDMLKKKQEQQQEEQADQYTATKKQLDRKLADSVTECEEQRRLVGNLKRKSQRQLAELQDMKLHLEEQVARNADLEKKQRKFDAEMQKLNEALKTEKLQREKLQRERDQLSADKFTLEQQLKNVQMDYELQAEKVGRLDRELTDITSASRDEKELMTLKRVKAELEAKVADQEEELDDQAGTIQQLEQGKLRLEMAQEKLRQQHSKELEEKEQELEDMRANTQKKLRQLEVQVEEEYSERQAAQREKREIERKMQMLAEQESPANRDTERRLRRDLKRTRALLADAQMMLDRQKDGQASRASIKQLRNQLEDAEYSMAAAIKARKGLEMENTELQTQMEDLTRAKHEMEERLLSANRMTSEVQSKLEENEEDMAEIMKKFKAAVQQQSVDQITLQDQSAQIEQLTSERESLRETLSGLQTNLEYMQTSMIDKQASARLEAKIRDLESRLELEQTSRHRYEVQVTRLKENIEQLSNEREKISETDTQNADMVKRLQRQVRELREEACEAQRKENEASQRKVSLEKKIETMETEYDQSQSDLRLAFKRISDLQAVIEDGMDSEDEDDEDSVPLSEDETDDSDLDVDYLDRASSGGTMSPSTRQRVSTASLPSPDQHTAPTNDLDDGR